jgi:hypothetical protein
MAMVNAREIDMLANTVWGEVWSFSMCWIIAIGDADD